MYQFSLATFILVHFSLASVLGKTQIMANGSHMNTFISNEHLQNMEEKGNCFSEDNFNAVYKYIESKIKDSASYYSYEGYELYLSSSTDISFKQDGYTLARVNKKNGIYSLSKILKDNNEMVKKTNELFCQLLSEAKE